MRIVTSVAGNDDGSFADVLKIGDRRIVILDGTCTSTGERASTKGTFHAQTITVDRMVVAKGVGMPTSVLEHLESLLEGAGGTARLPFDNRDEDELDPVERGQAVTVDGSGVVLTLAEVADLTGVPLEQVEELDEVALAAAEAEARAVLDERDEEVTEDLAEEGTAPEDLAVEGDDATPVPVVETMAEAWLRESAPWYHQRPADALITELAALELDADVVIGLIGIERRTERRPTVLAFLGERAWELGLEVPEEEAEVVTDPAAIADALADDDETAPPDDGPPVARPMTEETTKALLDGLTKAGMKLGPGPIHATEDLEAFLAGIAAWQVVDVINALDDPAAVEWLLELELARKARKRVADRGRARLEVLAR